jgi:hypothetical protein
MRVPFAQQTLRGLSLAAVFAGLTAQAHASSEGLTLVNAKPVTRGKTSQAASNPSNPASTSQSIVLARPLEDEVPNFLNDLDTYLMSDELVNEIEDRYAMRLREFSMKQGFLAHTRDTKLRRNYVGTPAEEQAVRDEMAGSMKKYMLVRGLPKYLSSKKETRFIGESYTQAVSMAQSIGRVEIKSKDDSWKFGSGVNPFTSKAWMKYSNASSTLEAYGMLNDKNSPAVILTHSMGPYVPWCQYYLTRNAFETGLRYRYSANLDSEIKTYMPFADKTLPNTVTYLSSTYRF